MTMATHISCDPVLEALEFPTKIMLLVQWGSHLQASCVYRKVDLERSCHTADRFWDTNPALAAMPFDWE